jgi:hypothetical protein
MSFMRAWRGCDQRVCRRARRCAGRTLACLAQRNKPAPTPEQVERATALLHRAINRRLAQVDTQELAEEAS